MLARQEQEWRLMTIVTRVRFVQHRSRHHKCIL